VVFLDVPGQVFALSAVGPGVDVLLELRLGDDGEAVQAVRRVHDGEQGWAAEGFLHLLFVRGAEASEEPVEGRGAPPLGQLASELLEVGGIIPAVVAVWRGDPFARDDGPLGAPVRNEHEPDLGAGEERGDLEGSKARGLVQKDARLLGVTGSATGAAGVTRLAEEDAGCGVVSGVSSSSSSSLSGGRGVASARASGMLGGTSGTSGAAVDGWRRWLVPRGQRERRMPWRTRRTREVRRGGRRRRQRR
jgi:hypothetical protein